MRGKNGTSFQEALVTAGLNSKELTTIHDTRNGANFYVELHIEQDSVLEREGVSIGVVESIVGMGELVVVLNMPEPRQCRYGATLSWELVA